MPAADLISFWNREPFRDLTALETEILRKTEKKIEKTGCPTPDISCQCFIHPINAYNSVEKKIISPRCFVFGIFIKESSTKNNQKIYLRCNEIKCVNPAHFVKTTNILGRKLIKIGCDIISFILENQKKRLYDFSNFKHY